MSYSRPCCGRGREMLDCCLVAAAQRPQGNTDRDAAGLGISSPSRAYPGCPPLPAHSPTADTELPVLIDRAFIGMPHTNGLSGVFPRPLTERNPQ